MVKHGGPKKGQNNKKAQRGVKMASRGVHKKKSNTGTRVPRVIPVAYVSKPKRSTLPAASAGWQKCSFFMGEFNHTRQSSRIVLNPGLWRRYVNAAGTGVDMDKTYQFAIPAVWQSEFFRMQKYAMRGLKFTFTPEHGTSTGSNVVLRYRSDSSESDGTFLAATKLEPWLCNKLNTLPTLTEILEKAGSGLHGPFTSMSGVKTIAVPLRASGTKRLRFFNENHQTFKTPAAASLEKNYADPRYVPTAEEALMDYGVVEFAVSGVSTDYKYYVTCEFDVKLSEWTSANHSHPVDIHPEQGDLSSRGLLMANDFRDMHKGFTTLTLSGSTGITHELPWTLSPSDSIIPPSWHVHNASTDLSAHRRFVPTAPGTYTFKASGTVQHALFAPAWAWREFDHKVYLSLSKYVDHKKLTEQFVPLGSAALWSGSSNRIKVFDLAFSYPYLLTIEQSDVDAGTQYRIEYQCFRATGTASESEAVSRMKLTGIEIQELSADAAATAYSQYSVLHVDTMKEFGEGLSGRVSHDLMVDVPIKVIGDTEPDNWETLEESVDEDGSPKDVNLEFGSSEAPSETSEDAGVFLAPPSPPVQSPKPTVAPAAVKKTRSGLYL